MGNSWTFPDQCEIPRLFHVFQVGGHPGMTELIYALIYSVSQKIPPLPKFSDIFPKWLGIFSQNFTHLLYNALQIFTQLSATLTKLCHIKRDHHNALKMSTIDRKAGWVVALNMA